MPKVKEIILVGLASMLKTRQTIELWKCYKKQYRIYIFIYFGDKEYVIGKRTQGSESLMKKIKFFYVKLLKIFGHFNTGMVQKSPSTCALFLSWIVTENSRQNTHKKTTWGPWKVKKKKKTGWLWKGVVTWRSNDIGMSLSFFSLLSCGFAPTAGWFSSATSVITVSG